MAEFLITAPNGKKYRVTGANREGALAALKQQLVATDQGAMEQRVAAAKAGTLPMQPGSAERAAAADAMAGTPGAPSAIEDVLMAVGAGGLRGVAGLADLPGMPMRAAESSGLITPEVADVMRNTLRMAVPAVAPLMGGEGPTFREGLGTATGGYSEYQAQTTPGAYAGTVAEFMPGAAIGGGGIGNLLRYGAIPGVASEAAGQATEGTALEPWARAAAALAAPAITARAGAFVGDDLASMANRLKGEGVGGITAGQAKASEGLMRAEGRLQPTGSQLDDYTAAIMRQIGSAAPKATPEALLATEKAIVAQMDDAVRGVPVTATTQDVRAAANVALRYAERVPVGQLTPRVKGIANEIAKATNKPLELSQLKEWRSDIGALTVSPDAATREAAHGLRTLIDDMTDQALTAAGRQDDIASLAAGREAYRNYIGVRDAASRAGAETGTLSPQALNQSMIRAQGREAYATGRSTPMTEFTRAGAAVLRAAPSVSAGGQRAISGALPAMLGSLGAGAGYAAGGPTGIALGGLLGAAAPSIGQAAMRSGPIQSLLRDPASIANALRLAPGLLAQ